MLVHRFRRLINGILTFLIIGIVLVFDLMPQSNDWSIKLLGFCSCIVAITLGRIMLNALQAFLLRRTDDLESHIFQ